MLLELTSVRKSFQDGGKSIPILEDATLRLDAGETLALTGESGSGKSTLLHIVAGLEPVDAGSVTILGKNVTRLAEAERAELRRSTVAVVFQQFNLIPSLTVGDNIAFHAKLSGRYDDAFASHMIDATGLTAHLDKYPEALSGGQQQRAAILRALVAKPKLLLADEPTGNLDEKTAEAVMAQMLALVAEADAALLLVTHSEKIAAAMDRRAHLSGGVLT
ncbi:MAG: ABC transporter ATP-binding protein [Pseudomonadota bacterium]